MDDQEPQAMNEASDNEADIAVDVLEDQHISVDTLAAPDAVDTESVAVDTESAIVDTSVDTSVDTAEETKKAEATAADVEETAAEGEKQEKSNRLPLSKIKLIMKTDPDVNNCSGEAAMALCRLTEHFIKFLTEESYRHTKASGRKTVQKKDIEEALLAVDQLLFLDGVLVD